MPLPEVGRMVHYVPPEETDLGEFPIAALIISVKPKSLTARVDLFLFPNSRMPTAPFFEKVMDVPFGGATMPNSWCWPESPS